MPVATVGRIPVRNLWLLMLYASRLYRGLPTVRRFAAEENPDEIPDLVAEILTRAVERRLRRNLSSEFDRRGPTWPGFVAVSMPSVRSAII